MHKDIKSVKQRNTVNESILNSTREAAEIFFEVILIHISVEDLQETLG